MEALIVWKLTLFCITSPCASLAKFSNPFHEPNGFKTENECVERAIKVGRSWYVNGDILEYSCKPETPKRITAEEFVPRRRD